MTVTAPSSTAAEQEIFPLVLDGTSLTTAQVAAAARRPGTAVIKLAAEAIEAVRRSADLRERLVESGDPIYGTTTGFGDSSRHHISPDKAADLQRNLIRYHLNGTGPIAPAEVVRATMVVRANCLARGCSGIRPEVVELLAGLVNADVLPIVPERGSVGASGDLVPLCYLAAVVIGEGEATWRGRRMQARQALREAGLSPLTLQAKEALALINGTSFMSGFAALAVEDALRLAGAAEICTALASQVLLGHRGHFAPFAHSHKPHPGQVASAAAVHRLLEGSALVADTRAVDTTWSGPGHRELPRGIQDRYSIRCAPHVIGVLRDTLAWVRAWVTTEINSANDNPLFDAATETIHNAGNFYGGHIGQAMDALKLAVASVADLLDRQLALVVDEKFSNGLPANLAAAREPDDYQAGLHHGFKGMQIAASALAAEALKCAVAPATAFSRSTEAHNQDKVSMGSIAARDARAVIEIVEQLTAIHLHALCQAADLRGAGGLSPATRAVHELIRAQAPFVDADRRLDHDIARIAELVHHGTLETAR